MIVLPLPQDFRPADVLAFHGRDPSGLAEQVGADNLRKGLAWNGQPACLTLSFDSGAARVTLSVDGETVPGDQVAALARRMLGLDQPVEAFEQRYGGHPELGRLIASHPGLRLPVAASPFEALSWAITGQQISVGAAVSIRRRMIQAANIRHSGGLLCPPDAKAILELGEDGLRAAGLSGGKARTLHEVSRRVAGGELQLDPAIPAEELGRRLLDAPGIGPWTVSYTLLRGFGWLDGSLHGDAAVRRGLQSLRGEHERPSERQVETWLAPFSPWRALVAAHLWAWKAATKAY